MKFALLFLFSISLSHAFTLNNNFGAKFGKSKVKVYVDGYSNCSNILITPYDLKDMIAPAVNDYWNQVPTSKLKLTASGFNSGTNNISTGILCSPTDDQCISSAGGALIPPVDHIVVACNSHSDNFSGNNVLAVTIPNKFRGTTIKGAVILINDRSGSAFRDLSRKDKIAVIAHEIGHAIGLGHSEDKAALMYYSTSTQRKSLGQDDIDGVTYLYPVKFDGCGLVGGIISTDKIDPQMWQMGIGFGLFLMILNLMKKILKLFNRSQRRPAL